MSIHPSLVFVLALLGGGCRAEPQPALSPAHAAAIRDSVRVTLAEIQRLSAAARWDSLAAYYGPDPDFRWIEGGGIVARSVAEIRAGLAKVPAGTRIVTTYERPHIVALGAGAAVVVTAFRTELIDSASSGPPVGFGGMMTVSMVHRGARWTMQTGQASSTR